MFIKLNLRFRVISEPPKAFYDRKSVCVRALTIQNCLRDDLQTATIRKIWPNASRPPSGHYIGDEIDSPRYYLVHGRFDA